jgi:DNA segregation ATPase FtsK/SpoIIIE, S-DNA-T family
MTQPERRRIGAVSALVLGAFLALSLIPPLPTGPLGRGLGEFLWRTLGVGAVGMPLLGLAVGLAGFDRLPMLDMKRAAILVAGLSVLVPYLIGVVTDITPEALDPAQDARALAALLTGTAPGFVGWSVMRVVGQIGGILVGFLSLSALTLLTMAWHPLRRLERGTAGEVTSGRPRARSGTPAVARDDADEDPVPAPVPRPSTARPPSRPQRPAREAPVRARAAQGEGDELPPLELLTPPAPQDTAADEAQLDRLGALLIEALRTFKVEGSIAGRTSGPVVTQFEVVPAPGVKVGRIVALSDDLAIKMRTPSVRVAPIPGKGAVGVEVPNPTARMVTLRELLEAGEWDRSRATLPIPLGRDLEGKPVIADLARMPHLLIAGATGSGKSVAINTIITGLVYRYTPVELRFLMVDPKMVELSMYNALPHMRHRVVTDSRDAATALKWAVFEMGRRYALLHANGARNVGDFNRKVQEGKALRHPAPPPATLTTVNAEAPGTPPPPPVPEVYTEGVLPYIVVIVDELADLMMTVQGEVETPLAMLAQKARAIGIHLLLVTQRPSVNVITGLIKANFPSRIAFRVASKVDSRTILDQNGAEALLGNGDMLFLPPGKSEPMRLQGSYIGTEETERLMHWFEARRAAPAGPAVEADILALIRAQEAEEDEGGLVDVGDRDTLFREAAEICIQHQGGSTSLLQRKLRIGYGRAARIIDQLHYAGILGPPDGSKPREVLVGLEQLDEYMDA